VPLSEQSVVALKHAIYHKSHYFELTLFEIAPTVRGSPSGFGLDAWKSFFTV